MSDFAGLDETRGEAVERLRLTMDILYGDFADDAIYAGFPMPLPDQIFYPLYDTGNGLTLTGVSTYSDCPRHGAWQACALLRAFVCVCCIGACVMQIGG